MKLNYPNSTHEKMNLGNSNCFYYICRVIDREPGQLNGRKVTCYEEF